MTATETAVPFNTPASTSATLLDEPEDLARALKTHFRRSQFDSETLKEYFKENRDPYTTLITDDEAVETFQRNLKGEQEPEITGHPSQLASNHNIVYAFPGHDAGKKVLNFFTPAAWKKAGGREHASATLPRANSGHRRSDKFLEAEYRFDKLRKRLTGKGGGYKRASQYSELSELANAVPAPHLTPAMSLEQLPEDESGEEVVLVGPPPKNLRTLSTGSVQSLPYMSREHAQLILTNPDLPSPPISPADSLLPRLNVPATIDEEGSLSSKSASTSPSSIDSKELKTPERLTVVLLPDRPYYGIEPVEKSLSRKNSTPRSSPWDGPVARGPKRSKRSSQPHTPSPLRSNPSRISPASSSDSEDDYPPRSYTSGLSPLVGTNALLMSHMGYLTPQITPPHQDSRPLAHPQVYSPYLAPPPNTTAFQPQVPYSPPQHYGAHLSTPAAYSGVLPFTPPGFIPQSMTPLVQSMGQMSLSSGGVATVALPTQSPWNPVVPMAPMYSGPGSPYVQGGRW